MPALLTSTSISPASRASRWTSSRSTRSAAMARAPRPSSRAVSRAETTTCMPSSSRARTRWRPRPPAAPVTRAVRPARSRMARLVSHRREQDHFPDRAPPAEQHHQAVDAQAEAGGGRHPVLERLDEDLVVGLGLLAAGRQEALLVLEARPLLVRVVELGERVADLDAADD